MSSHQWTPPPDPSKPTCPYLPGFTVTIRAHAPPLPFGGPLYKRELRPDIKTSKLKKFADTEIVLRYPPIETSCVEETTSSLQLVVTKPLAIGNARGAQLVVCSVQSDTADMPFSAVAKIFDALYYPRVEPVAGRPDDPTYSADRDYSVEAHSYQILQREGLTGRFAPAYHGSWTFTVPITDKDGFQHDRPVRLVLIENLDGLPLQQLLGQNEPSRYAHPDASHLGEKLQLEVITHILDGVVKQRHKGVSQEDIALRNIILAPSPYSASFSMERLRVVLIDYNNAVLEDHRQDAYAWAIASKAPQNPAEFFWTESMLEMSGWMPGWWFRDGKRRREWLWSTFAVERVSEYDPIIDRLDIESGQRIDREDL